MTTRRSSQRGTTLLETSLSTTLLVGIVGTAFSLTRESQGVLIDCTRALVDRAESSSAFEQLAEAIAQANGTTLQIDTQPTEGDRLLLQVPLAFAGSTTTWGATSTDRALTTQWAGGFDEYTLVASQNHRQKFRLIRRPVDTAGQPLAAAIDVADGIDGVDAAGNKGFSVFRDAGLVRVTLRIGHAIDVTVRLRNL
jgi:hypothetical protein